MKDFLKTHMWAQPKAEGVLVFGRGLCVRLCLSEKPRDWLGAH